MFIDQAIILVKAGDGGRGHCSFRREKYIPKGGPAGGDGGKGADVVFVADDSINTLLDFRGRYHWDAAPGEPGGSKQCHGSNAEDLVIRVPPGTLVYNNKTGELIVDLKPGDRAIVAKGGKGGWGNEHFKSSTNQTPKTTTPGEKGEDFELRLELKLIADVGLVGLPNAGKSTLLAAVTQAHPKIADYPFTTLAPQLGIAALDTSRRLVLADIPGLIEGAAEGAGLGHDFLRHVERTRVIVHLLDACPPDGTTPAENYRLIREELSRYSPELAEKREVVVLNKIDLLPTPEERTAALAKFRAELKLGHGDEVLAISGASRIGTKELLDILWTIVNPRTEAWRSAPVA